MTNGLILHLKNIAKKSSSIITKEIFIHKYSRNTKEFFFIGKLFIYLSLSLQLDVNHVCERSFFCVILRLVKLSRLCLDA